MKEKKATSDKIFRKNYLNEKKNQRRWIFNKLQFFFSFAFLHFLNYGTQYLASKKQDTNHTFTQLSKLYTNPTRSIHVMIILVL